MKTPPNPKEGAVNNKQSDSDIVHDKLKWQKYYKHDLASSSESMNFENKEWIEAKICNILKTCPAVIAKAAAAANINTNDISVELLIVLYTSCVMAGVLAPETWLNYDNKRNYLPLMLLIVFSAASGKGIVGQARKMLYKINDELKADYDGNIKLYKEALRNYRQNPTGFPPEKPKLKLILSPGNITSAKLIELLADLDGEEILTMIETEMDAVGISASNENGAMNSAIYRQAYHHEAISKIIKKDGELQVANNPKMSLVLSGTQNQVSKLLHSNSDGLMSRFTVLKGDAPLFWKDARPCADCKTSDEHFESLSNDFYAIWKYHKGKKVEIKFTNEQWDCIKEFGTYHLVRTHYFTGESADSIVKRHGLMICRLAAIFTMLRYYEQKLSCDNIYCNDDDFGNALFMIEYSLKCSLELFRALPGERNEAVRADLKTKYIQMLPDSFSTETNRQLLTKLVISERTSSRWLKEFIESGLIVRVMAGKYEKTSLAAMAAVAPSENLLNESENYSNNLIK